MSQHPSLRSSDKDKQHRSVLKRYERLKILKEKERWSKADSVFGLQKVKVLRFRIKKEKAAKEVEGAEAPAAPGLVAAPGGTQPTPGQAKATAKASAAPAKESAKGRGAGPAGKETKK